MIRSSEGPLGVNAPVVTKQHAQPGNEGAWLRKWQETAVELKRTPMIGVAEPDDELAAEDTAMAALPTKEELKSIQLLVKEFDPLAASVKKAVRIAVAKVGDEVLSDDGVKDTMKRVVKQAVKEAVTEAVQDAQEAQNVKDAKATRDAKNET